jgi:hypothetical protein
VSQSDLQIFPSKNNENAGSHEVQVAGSPEQVKQLGLH